MKKRQPKYPPKKTCGTEMPEPNSSPVCYAESAEVLPEYRWEMEETKQRRQGTEHSRRSK